jgi:hypothetical protein
MARMPPTDQGLKLMAFDVEDLTVLAAHLQDAVGVIGDMAFRAKEKRFVALINRFERAAAAGEPGRRRRAALRIDRATRAEVQGLDLKRKGEVVALLTATFVPDADPDRAPAGQLTLVFAGNGAIRLHVECLEILLEDLGPVWAARVEPRHDDVDATKLDP